MKYPNPIRLEIFRKTVEELAADILKEFSGAAFNHAGINPVYDAEYHYSCTPINTTVFAHTGGDGVHFSILELSDEIQPIIITVPMNFGGAVKNRNLILGENLPEFLSLGFYNGWFSLEQLCYDKDGALNYYAGEDMEADYQNGPDIQFVKKLRDRMGYQHIPLHGERLNTLENSYFKYLQFRPGELD